MGNTNFANSRIYSGHYFPVLVDMNFIVDPADPSGTGISDLKGAYVEEVFMHSTASVTGFVHVGSDIVDSVSSIANLVAGMHISGTGIPNGTTILDIESDTSFKMSALGLGDNASDDIVYAGAGGVTNPANGNIVVKLADNYNEFLFATSMDAGPAGSIFSIDGGAGPLTVGDAYIILSVGDSTQDEWEALGVPDGVEAAEGVSFIAARISSGAGTGTVTSVTDSGINKYQIVGNPTETSDPLDLTPAASTAVFGSWIQFQALSGAGPNAPATGTTIYLQCYMSNSSITLGGQ